VELDSSGAGLKASELSVFAVESGIFRDVRSAGMEALVTNESAIAAGTAAGAT
jgi:hypothetical protein